MLDELSNIYPFRIVCPLYLFNVLIYTSIIKNYFEHLQNDYVIYQRYPTNNFEVLNNDIIFKLMAHVGYLHSHHLNYLIKLVYKIVVKVKVRDKTR